MALIQTGELLAVTTRNVTRKSDGQSFDIRQVLVFDADRGASVEMGVGRDFPAADFLALAKDADRRPSVSFDCSLYNGRLQVERVIDVANPVPAKAS